MLETVRQYALDRLLERGETGELRDRHLAWFTERYEGAVEALSGADSARWMDRIDADHDNVRAGLEWGFGSERGSPMAFRLATGVSVFWARRGYLHEGIRWPTRALETEGESPVSRSRALQGLSSLLGLTGAADRAVEIAVEAEALAREAGDTLEVMRALGTKGANLLRQGDLTALSALEEALELAERWGSDTEIWLPRIVTNLGEVLRLQGRLEEAERRYREALDLTRRVGYRVQDDIIRFNLGQIAMLRGEPSRAAASYRDGLMLARDLGRRGTLGWCVLGMGQVLAEQGDLERAARIFGAGEAMQEKLGYAMDVVDRPLYERALARIREGLSPDRLDAAWGEGRAMTTEEAVEEALAVE
jgi:non-specific serine/threonine protein kinase